MNGMIRAFTTCMACGGLAILMSGCQTAPVKVGWYINNQEASADPSMHLALLNTGRCDIPLSDMVINPSSDADKTGWRYSKTLPILRPGELVVMSTKDFQTSDSQAFGSCQIPVRVLIRSWPHGRFLETTVTGTMPNYLDQRWLNDCEKKLQP